MGTEYREKSPGPGLRRSDSACDYILHGRRGLELLMAVLLALLLGCCAPWPIQGLDNGLANTPPMGLSTWSVFRDGVNDTLVRQLADALKTSGLAAAGYNYLLVDDGWEGEGCKGCLPNRDESGHLVVDPTKFPNGLKPGTSTSQSRQKADSPPLSCRRCHSCQRHVEMGKAAS